MTENTLIRAALILVRAAGLLLLSSLLFVAVEVAAISGIRRATQEANLSGEELFCRIARWNYEWTQIQKEGCQCP